MISACHQKLRPTKMPSSPSLSVALVTRNRPESLKRTLRSLAAQSLQPFEVIVSDDSENERAAVVEHIVKSFGHQYIRGPRCGLYSNRNYVIRRCRGTHIRTMDDDHEFPNGHLAACIAAIERDPTSVWIIGEFHSRDPVEGSAPLCPGQLTPRGFSATPPNPHRCWAIADGATIYPRVIFDQGHAFCEDFRFGAAYLEFGSRLHNLGYRIRFLSETYILHHLDVANRSFMDEDLEIASRAFAALCHSFIYQPTMYNRVMTVVELVTRWFRTGCRTGVFWQAGISFQRRLSDHRREVSRHTADDDNLNAALRARGRRRPRA